MRAREYTDDEVDSWRESMAAEPLFRSEDELARDAARLDGWLLGSAFAHMDRAERLASAGHVMAAQGSRAVARDRLAAYRARVGY